MAHHEQRMTGDLDALILHLDREIVGGSVTAKHEVRINHQIGDARMVVSVWERYSAMGSNRLSLNVSVLAVGEDLSVSVVTAGGSEAMFWKLNTFGEDAFLQKGVDALASFKG
ncbi:DUF6054 family protein [Nocardioides sp. CN2-186]|uniref:DUF6054 family protein n=1 Tax=Nocardioides tweenelious TaxID=3156607 RepID=UPI0032B5BA72